MSGRPCGAGTTSRSAAGRSRPELASPAQAACALADPARGRQQPALVPHDAPRSHPGLRARSRGGRAVAPDLAGAPSRLRRASRSPCVRGWRAPLACCRSRGASSASARPWPGRSAVEVAGPTGTVVTMADLATHGDTATIAAEVRIPDIERWWPHTHGAPALYDVRLTVGDGEGRTTVDAGRVGFRELAPGPGPTTTSTATDSPCRSTASRSSHAARCGPRSTSSAWLRRPRQIRSALLTVARRRHEHDPGARGQHLRDDRVPRPVR